MCTDDAAVNQHKTARQYRSSKQDVRQGMRTGVADDWKTRRSPLKGSNSLSIAGETPIVRVGDMDARCRNMRAWKRKGTGQYFCRMAMTRQSRSFGDQVKQLERYEGMRKHRRKAKANPDQNDHGNGKKMKQCAGLTVPVYSNTCRHRVLSAPENTPRQARKEQMGLSRARD